MDDKKMDIQSEMHKKISSKELKYMNNLIKKAIKIMKFNQRKWN